MLLSLCVGEGGPFDTQNKPRVVPRTPGVHRLVEVQFVTHPGIGMTRRTPRRVAKRVAGRAGITLRVTPHAVRHMFAVRGARSRVSTASPEKLLGHDRLETTEIYLNISPEDALRGFRDKVVR